MGSLILLLLACAMGCATRPGLRAVPTKAPIRAGEAAPSPAPALSGSPSPSAVSASLQSASTSYLTMVAVGDIRLDGPVGQVARAHGPAAPTAGVKAWLKGDILFGNLETAVTERGQKAVKKWTFRSPPKNLSTLQAAGFTVLNLANNHVMDFGDRGLRDTLKSLEQHRLPHIGAGMNLDEARKPLFFDVQGVRVGLLGLTSTIPEANWANSRRSGVAFSDWDHLADWIRSAKAQCDVLVVSFHGGTELSDDPNEVQHSFAHAAVDAGADLVLGHHPHVIQPVEVYRGKAILYSIGNFLFVSPTPKTRWSVIVHARVSKRGVDKVQFFPVDTGYGRLRPAPAEGAEAVRAALDREGALKAHPELLSLAP